MRTLVNETFDVKTQPLLDVPNEVLKACGRTDIAIVNILKLEYRAVRQYMIRVVFEK